MIFTVNDIINNTLITVHCKLLSPVHLGKHIPPLKQSGFQTIIN